ncbi:MAG TPA: lysozyme [Rhizomicrobium sp.]|jgi:lysozyme|nr:lysozyme [Rhizomicrobium sp.]
MSTALTPEGISLIKHFETLRLDAYVDPVGVVTIGYGHTGKVRLGDTVTPEQADELLRRDLNDAQSDVLKLVRVPLNDNEYSALVSLVFNIGGPTFSRSTCLRRLNSGDRKEAAEAMQRFVKGHVRGRARTFRGLERRRLAERELFLCAPGEAKSGISALTAQPINLPPLKGITSPIQAEHITPPIPVPAIKVRRSHIAVAASAGGIAAVPVATNNGSESLGDYVVNIWQMLPSLDIERMETWCLNVCSWLSHIPYADAARTTITDIGLFAQSHESASVFAGATIAVLTRAIYARIVRAV